MVAACLTACGGSDEEEQDLLESFYSNVAFAGVWNVSEVNIGRTWQDAKTAGYKDSQIIIAEDSCYESSGRFGYNYGRYRMKNGKANCLDYYGKLQLVCQFKNINGNTATATITDKSGVTLDFHMERDNSNPALYLDPLKYLDGYWDIDGDDGGYVQLRGYSADIHTSKFDYGCYIERSSFTIYSLSFGYNFTGRFNLSREPYTLHIQGRYPDFQNINFTCVKRSE